MTAPATERPALTVVPAPRPAVEVVALPAARAAFTEMLAALGVDTRPARTIRTDALLTLLMQASGATVAVPQDVAEHAAWLAAVDGYRTTEAAS